MIYKSSIIFAICLCFLLAGCLPWGFETGATYYNMTATLQPEILVFPVSVSSVDMALLNTNFTAFQLQVFNESNISAWDQDAASPCYEIENTGDGTVDVEVKVSSYNSSFTILLAEGLDNVTATPQLYLNESYQTLFNLTVSELAVNENLTFEYNKTTNLSQDRLLNLTLVNGSGGVVSSDDYTEDLDLGQVTFTNASYPLSTTRNKTAELVLLKTNVTVYLDNDNLLNSTILVLYNDSGTVFGSDNYTQDLDAGSITYLGSDFNLSLVNANYTYYYTFTLQADYSYYSGQKKNVSCFGTYTNAVLNETYNVSIDWNHTGI